MNAFSGWLLGLATWGPIGAIAGYLKAHVEHAHWHRHHTPGGEPRLLWSRQVSHDVEDREAHTHHRNFP